MKPVIRFARGATYVILALGVYIQTGCNLFSFMADDNTGDLNYHGLILKGNQAINKGQYANAVSYFNQAQRVNIKGSEAFLYHAKATISLYNLDYNILNDEFQAHRDRDTVISGAHSTGQGLKGIPFVDSTTTLGGIDSIYHPVFAAVGDLEHILRQRKDTVFFENGFKSPPDGDTASDGVISQGVARLDLGLLQAVKALLAPLDLDRNGHVDLACGVNICPDTTNAACAPAYHSTCSNGRGSENERFKNFKALTATIDIENLDSKDVHARDVSTNPNDINEFIKSMQEPIAGSNHNLDSVTGVMNQNNEQGLSSQLQDMVSNIKELSNFLGYMHYNDHIDNDYDIQGGPTTVPMPMLWHDFDRDGGVRYDYTVTQDTTGLPKGSGNIGNPVHRNRHAGLYMSFTELGAAYPKLRADSSVNSRFATMRKKCKDWVDTIVNVNVNNSAVKVTCDSVSPVLKASTLPPSRSDWISGTAGVDEEMIDNFDNDYDGLQDEDARRAVGFDDDNDGVLNVNMIDSVKVQNHPLTRMLWTDLLSHANKCPDIDTTIPMAQYAARALPAGDARAADPAVQAAYQRAFCVGSLEHRLYQARKRVDGTGDSLNTYYSTFGEGSNEDCRKDIDKLNPAYLSVQNPTETEKSIACTYKHIWRTGFHPPRSEWTGGVFGIDEESYDAVQSDGTVKKIDEDGVDNDGDGWIDEDVNK